MEKPQFFFCYNRRLFKFLRFDRGIQYICTGLHEYSLDKFWCFLQSQELTDAINEYKQLHKQEV